MAVGALPAPVLCGLIAGLLSLYGYIPYIYDTLRGRCRPQRSSWLIWSVPSCVFFYTHVTEGAGASLFFAAVQCVCTVIVFLTSLRWGMGSFLRAPDVCAIGVACIGLALWYWTHDPLIALGLSILVGMSGGVMTVIKAYKRPHTESFGPWVIAAVASTLSLVAVGEMNWVLLAYPAYLWTLRVVIVGAMVLSPYRSPPQATWGGEFVHAPEGHLHHPAA